MAYLTMDPLRSLARMQNEMARLFQGNFENTDLASTTAFVPPVDIIERNEDLVLFSDLPGVRLEDIEVSVENRTLTLSGERKEMAEYRDSNVYRAERPVGRFTRVFSLPATVDVNRITAEHNDGVLRVVLPKADDARPRRIEIKRADH